MVFVDLETTGATGTVDRITEIGIVEVNEEGEVREWSSLVNPQTSIPPFIQNLTGISDAMVAEAPTFEELAEEVLMRLHGRHCTVPVPFTAPVLVSVVKLPR